MDTTRLLDEILPYRMNAVAIFNYALKLTSKWPSAPPIALYVDGKQLIEGNLNAFTNPAIEAGLVHCRALLEFLGLCSLKGALANIGPRKPSDVGIEGFSNANGPLPLVTPAIALAAYTGPPSEAEQALLTVFHVANKGLAHTTQDLKDHPEHGRMLEIASRGIPSLVLSYVYAPLGLPAPDYAIRSRLRERNDEPTATPKV